MIYALILLGMISFGGSAVYVGLCAVRSLLTSKRYHQVQRQDTATMEWERLADRAIAGY